MLMGPSNFKNKGDLVNNQLVTIVPDFVTKVEVKEYDASNIKNVYSYSAVLA